MKRALSLILVLAMALGLLAGCVQPQDPTTVPTTPTTQPTTQPTEPEGDFSDIPEGYNQVTFYWSWEGSYENCDVWAWWGDVAGKGYIFHECEYGAKALSNALRESLKPQILELADYIEKNV